MGQKLDSNRYASISLQLVNHSDVKRWKKINAEKSDSYVSEAGTLVLAEETLATV